MSNRAARKLDFLLTVLLCMVFVTTRHVPHIQAQAKTESPAQNIADTWQGTVHAGRDLRTVVKISKADDGGYKAVFYSIDQGGDSLPVSKITLEGTTVKMALAMGGTYEGKLSSDGKTITGDLSQGPKPLALNLTRATPGTEWTIPPAEPKLLPMDANAHPSFAAATIKASPPNKPGKGFGFRDGHFVTMNTNLNELIAFAYGLHAMQITDAPPWLGTDLYDIEAKPDTEGQPSLKQMQMMVQKLMADRFKLAFHHDKKELSAYVITVASGGPKMTRSAAGPNDPPGFRFGGLGDLMVKNLSVADFAAFMQSVVMDKPVVDQTGLPDKYDFDLKWTPDDSQFAQFKGTSTKAPPPTDDPNAPPALSTAMQAQLGLKMGPANVPDDVVVIDHVEKPSEN
jgi:bla regulator protein blaR1